MAMKNTPQKMAKRVEAMKSPDKALAPLTSKKTKTGLLKGPNNTPTTIGAAPTFKKSRNRR